MLLRRRMSRALGRSLSPLLTAFAALAVSLAAPGSARANDQIFPALPAAAAKIGWKDGFFLVDGKPTILRSGEIHYARVPRELWRDRLVRAKRAGLNTIQTYVFWNVHEPREGEFTFDGDVDLDAWLSLIEELGMYAVVRPGPYNCAEWESGGLPAWLTVMPNMELRTSYAAYVALADRYYEHVLPILAKHQIHRGGSLLMMQIENELFSTGWGTDGNAYTSHLYDKARALGLEIPLFYSGLHHGNDPAGSSPFGQRDVPWYTTEFWTGWFDFPGEPTDADVLRLARGTWKALEFGGGGYDYYVVHGGTNFGYGSDDEGHTTYDYRAPIGEAGQLHRSYPDMKRAAMFAGTFSGALATAQDGSGAAAPKVAAGIATYVRAGTGGTIVFLDNSGGSAIQTRLALSQPALDLPEIAPNIAVGAGEIRPIVVDASWTANASFDYIAAGVLGKIAIGGTDRLVVYGRTGEDGEIAVRFKTAPTAAPKAPWQWDGSASRAKVRFTYPANDDVTELSIDSGDGTAMTVLVMNTELADRTWFVDQSLFVGPSYVDDRLAVQFPESGGTGVRYTATGKTSISASAITAAPPSFGAWQYRDASVEAQPAYDDSAWQSSAEPQPMSAYDSFQNGYGWYRTTFHADGATPHSLLLGGMADRVLVFLDGTLQAGAGQRMTLAAPAGDHTLAILASHQGRSKMAGFEGLAGTVGYKGVWGPSVVGDVTTSVTQWRISVNGVSSSGASTYASPTFDDSTWAQVAPVPDSMGSQATYAWYRGTFQQADVTGDWRMWLGGADDHAWVYLNGKLLGTHDDWRTGALYDAGAGLVVGKNVIAICVKNDSGAGGLTGAVDMIHAAGGLAAPWRFRGGLGNIDESAILGRVLDWDNVLQQSWQSGATSGEGPRFFRADVVNPIPPHAAATVGIRTKGMSMGSVWMNGHNLGLFSGDDTLYAPEPWLTANNTVVIYDEQGKDPSAVTIEFLEVHAENDDLVVVPDAGAEAGADASADASGGSTADGGRADPDGGRTSGNQEAAGGAGSGESGCSCRLGAGDGSMNGVHGLGAIAAGLALGFAGLARGRRRRH